MGDRPPDRPVRVLLVPPPVRPRVGRRVVDGPPRSPRWVTEEGPDITIGKTPEPIVRSAEPPPDPSDPLTISSSYTVPLFGLAPERVANPVAAAEPVPDPQAPTWWPWVVAGVALTLAAILALAFISL